MTEGIEGTKIEEDLVCVRSFLTLPLKEQVFVENHCMSCSPIKSSVNVTPGSPGRKKGCQEPKAHVTFGGFRELCVAHIHFPKPMSPGCCGKVAVVVFPGIVLISLGFFYWQEAYDIFRHEGPFYWANPPAVL